jgi:alkylated DNA repair dioxygenase AlkB
VSLGDRRRIACCGIGTTGERWSWDLGHGDLLVMRDESQSDYAARGAQDSRQVGPRMNLTFGDASQIVPRESPR